MKNTLISLQVPVTQKPVLAFINKELIITVALEKDEKQIMSVKQFPLTKVGMDLAVLVGEALSDDYFIEFARNLIIIFVFTKLFLLRKMAVFATT